MSLPKYLSDLDWKRTYAITVVAGYMYDILFWPLAVWFTTIGTMVTGNQWPAPPLVPWEQLAVATANLAVIGYVQFKRDKLEVEAVTGISTPATAETETNTETKTTIKLKGTGTKTGKAARLSKEF